MISSSSGFLKDFYRKTVFTAIIVSLFLGPVSQAFAQEAEQKAEVPEAPVAEVEPVPALPETRNPVIEESPVQEVDDTEDVPEEQESADPMQEEEGKVEDPSGDPENMAMRTLGASPTSAQFEIPTLSQASVDQSTGALTYQYPISLPEGRAGMTPELSLSYNSRNSDKPDTIIALGWELSIPYIKREPIQGTENLYTSAYFSSSISGNLIAGTDTTSSPYTAYYPESDDGDYLKYTYNPDKSWTVTGKDGLTYVYGAAASSRQDDPADAAKVYKWMLTSITDTNGNSIQYTYAKLTGQIYPYQITYANHASAPAAHTVTFNYTTPSGYSNTVYNAAFPVTTTKILNTIVVSSAIDSNTATQTYSMGYVAASQNLKQKLLQTIRREGIRALSEVDEGYTDTTTYSYSTKTPGWEEGTFSLAGMLPANGVYTMKDIFTADFDLNGYTDAFVSNYETGGFPIYTKLSLNNGTTYTDVTSSWSLPSGDLGEGYAVVDVNGDHLPDLHPRHQSSTSVYMNTGSSFSPDTSGDWLMSNYVPESEACGVNVGDSESYMTNTFFFDINNDGLNDIVHFGGPTNFKVFLNTGTTWVQDTSYTFTINPGTSYTFGDNCESPNPVKERNYQTLIDINGDGKLDYVHERFGSYINTGSGFEYVGSYAMDFDSRMEQSGIADINGDGLVDYISERDDNNNHECLRVYLNTGAGFTMVNPSNFPTGCSGTASWSASALRYHSSDPIHWGSLADVTADGFPEIIGRRTSGQGEVRAANDGQSVWVDLPGSGNPWNTMMLEPRFSIYFDVNTDGVLDYISPSTGGPANASKVYLGKASVPNRMTQITTPFGAVTNIEYGTARTDYNDTDIAPMSVVRKIVQNPGYGQPSSVTQYAYEGGAYVIDPGSSQKRFAGFQKVTATESGANLSPLRITESYFHQANGSDSATNEGSDTELALIGKRYYSVTKNPGETLVKENWTNYGSYVRVTDPLTGRDSKFVYVAETVNKVTEPSAETGTAEAYTYDISLGERTQMKKLGFVDVDSDGTYADIAGDTQYEFTGYATNTGSTIVKPSYQDVRTGISTGDIVARKEYFYDSQSLGTIGTFGNLTKESQWISGSDAVKADSIYTYDAYGNMLTATNPRGATTTYAYDASTNSSVVSETNHLNHATAYEYVVGKLKKVTDPNGRITTYGYSNMGTPYRTTVQNSIGNQVTKKYFTQTAGVWNTVTLQEPVNSGMVMATIEAFDGTGRTIRVIKEDKNFTTGTHIGYFLKAVNGYDSLGRAITTTAPYGTSSSINSLMSVSVPADLVTTTAYDVFDRPITVTNVLGATSMQYAGQETTTTDANGNDKTSVTDASGNLVEVREQNGSSTYVTEYAYDIRNLLTGITDALGNVRAFAYNQAGWLIDSEDLHAPGDTTFGTSHFTYDLNGNQLTETQPNGTVVTRTYDMLDRVLSINSSSTTPVDFTMAYDACTNGIGRLCAVNGGFTNFIGAATRTFSYVRSYAYGISGVPTAMTLATLGGTYQTGYQYNLSDQVRQTTHPNGTVVRIVFGEWALPSQLYVTLPGQSENLFSTTSYHHTEQPVQTVIASGPTITNTYDATKLYRKTGTTATMGGTTLQSYAYLYDPIGNIISITEPGVTKTYTYDDLNRLAQAVYTPTPSGTPTTYNYAYDAVGNVLTANGNSYTYSQTGTANPHAVTAIGSDTYGYDANGNVTSAPNQTLAYNWQNQPETIVLGGGSSTAESRYDESGERFAYKTPSGIEIQVDEAYIVRNGTPEITLKVGDAPVGVVSNGLLYSTIADHLNTPVKEVNASGVVSESTTYDPFGDVIAISGTINTKRGYTGHEEDVETGLVYAEARYYNPASSRFNQQDLSGVYIGHQNFKDLIGIERKDVLSDPQQLNTYSYVRNNPINGIDPTGKSYLEVAASVNTQPFSGSVGFKVDFKNLRLDYSNGIGFAAGESADISVMYNPGKLPDERKYITTTGEISAGYILNLKYSADATISELKDRGIKSAIDNGGSFGIGTGVGVATSITTSTNHTLIDFSKENKITGSLIKLNEKKEKITDKVKSVKSEVVKKMNKIKNNKKKK